MPIERCAGRGKTDVIGFPVGCAGDDQILGICSAQLSSGRQCLLCERRGDFPLPTWWKGECEFEGLGGPSVQIVSSSLPSIPWLVLVFLEQRYIDGRFPIIGARTMGEATELALGRAVQVSRGARVQQSAQGQWIAGAVRIFQPRSHSGGRALDRGA